MEYIKKIIRLRSFQLLIVALIVLIIIFKLITPSVGSLKAPIKNQLHALQIEDPVTAYSYTSPAFQKSTSLDSFKRFIQDYSGLRNNDTIAFNSSEVKDGVGIITATLYSRSGSKTDITYQLVKVHKKWKIESMVIVPNGNDHPADTIVETTRTPATPTPLTTTNNDTPAPPASADKTAAVADATNVYEDASNNYSLRYPGGWEYARTDEGMLVFHKVDGNADNQTLISIMPLMTDDGMHMSVQQVADKAEDTIRAKAGSYKVVEDGLLPPGANKNENFHGHYTVYSYTLDNDKTIKQLQVIYFKSPTRAKFVIDYIAPEAEFDADLPAVRAMISTFTLT